MRFAISFGVNKSNVIKQLDFIGVEWCLDENFGKWIEIHLLGFMLFFDFEEVK